MGESTGFERVKQDLPATGKVADSVVQVRGDINFLGVTYNQRLGSGVFVENQDSGKCIAATTSYIAGLSGTSILTADGESRRVSKVTTDKKTGLAFLEIPDLTASQCHKLALASDTTKGQGSKDDVKAIGAIPNGFWSQGMQIETAKATADRQMTLPKDQISGAETVDVYDARVNAAVTHDDVQKPVKIKDFGGAPVVRDNALVGIIRGGNDYKIAVIPSSTIATAMKENNL